MSTEANAQAAASTPAAGTPAKLQSVPPDVRRRFLGGERFPADPARQKEEADAKAKADADEKQRLDKEKADADAKAEADAKAKAPKKPKAGPKLPDPEQPAAQVPGGTSLEEAVRKVLPNIQAGATPEKPAFSPELQQEIELARFAEQHQPDRYNGMAAKIEGFFTENSQLLDAKAKELGGVRSPAYREYLESDEYRQWVEERRPRYERGDKEKLKEAAISHRAKKEAAAELEPKLKELELKTLEVEHKPRIDALVQQVLSTSILAVPQQEPDPALEGFAKNPLKFGEEHPEEAQIIAQEAQQFVDYAKTVYRVDAGLEAVNPDDAKQKWIRNYMRTQNQLMREKYPTGLEMADGKILVDAVTYSRPEIRRDPRYRTWSADEMVAMIGSEGNSTILTRLSRRRDGIQKSVYVKGKAPENAGRSGQEDDESAGGSSPEAVTTRSAGGKKTPDTKKSRAATYA